ncbi:MAG TPA: GtrA family protein [Caldimonas sp.]|nr:GtrA family protein [Caldimonas sp.]
MTAPPDDFAAPPPGGRNFLRYLAVGAVATAVHYAVLVTLVEAGHVAPRFAAAAGAWIGAQVAFAGNARFTFGHAAGGVSAWWRFQLTALIGAAISFAVVAAGVRLGLHYLLAQVVATAIAVFATYEINRRWSFATPRRP